MFSRTRSLVLLVAIWIALAKIQLIIAVARDFIRHFVRQFGSDCNHMTIAQDFVRHSRNNCNNTTTPQDFVRATLPKQLLQCDDRANFVQHSWSDCYNATVVRFCVTFPIAWILSFPFGINPLSTESFHRIRMYPREGHRLQREAILGFKKTNTECRVY